MDSTALTVEQELRELYAARPESHGRAQISDVALLGSGYDADVYAFSLKEDGGEPRHLVLRIYAVGGGAEKASREFAVMRRLRDVGYPVPRVRIIECAPSLVGGAFLVMERVHGVSMGATYWSPPEEHRRTLQPVLCRLMARLHALAATDIFPEAEWSDPYTFVDREVAFVSTLLAQLGKGIPPSLRAALEWLRSRRYLVPCKRLSVLHSDFHPNNVLLCPDGAAFVIDWSNTRPGDYRSDLAWSRLITRADLQPDGGTAELEEYERLAAREVAGIEYFDVAACLRLLASTLVSLRGGAAGQGMRPEARDLMRRNCTFSLSVATLLQKHTSIRMPDLEDALSTAAG